MVKRKKRLKGGPSTTYKKVWGNIRAKDPEVARFMNSRQKMYMKSAKEIDKLEGSKTYQKNMNALQKLVGLDYRFVQALEKTTANYKKAQARKKAKA